MPVIGGESGKTLATVEALATSMLESGVGRRSVVVSVGGGVVTDIGGFLAGIFMRGVGCIHVPTTLLAMCDAAVGGKCGVDLGGAKNMLGVIRQPQAIVIDPDVLSTLSDRDYLDGLVEVVKIALMLDADVHRVLRKEMVRLLQRQPSALDWCIEVAVLLKMSLVVADEKEAGRRMLLNFGHTVGHAIETLTHFSVSHGEAVALGMVEEVRLLVPELHQDVKQIIESMGLRAELDPSWDRERLWATMQLDKKVAAGVVRVAVPSETGKGCVRELTKERFLDHGI